MDLPRFFHFWSMQKFIPAFYAGAACPNNGTVQARLVAHGSLPKPGDVLDSNERVESVREISYLTAQGHRVYEVVSVPEDCPQGRGAICVSYFAAGREEE